MAATVSGCPDTPRGSPMRAKVLMVASIALILVAVNATMAAANPAGLGLKLDIVSSPRPSVVTGGDTLVRLTGGHGLRPGEVRVFAGRRDVSDAFVAQPDGSL